MDLDNLKKVWQETEVKPSIDQHKIQQMLNNKGKSALSQLLRFEKIALWALIACLLCFPIFYKIDPIIFYMYCSLWVVSMGWQGYKIQFLKKIDFIEMGILDVSNKVNIYRKYILYEIIIGIILILIFFAVFALVKIPFDEMEPRLMTSAIISFIAGAVVALIAVLLIYKYIYMRNIKSLKESIKEVREFEKDNQ